MAGTAGSWSIAQEQGKSTYTYTYTVDESTAVTVSGLSKLNDYSVGTGYTNDGYIGVYYDNGVVYVNSSLLSGLGTGTVSVEGTDVTLAFEDPENITEKSEAEKSYTWNVVSNSATRYENTLNYYTLADNSKSITFTNKSSSAVAAVTGLSGVQDTTDAASVDGITIGNNGKITLATSIIGTTDTEVQDLDENDGITYQVTALTNGTTTASLIGGEDTSVWALDTANKTATYTQSSNAGWSLSSANYVKYTGASSVTSVVVKGISSTATEGDVAFTAYGTEVVLKDGAIGNENISIQSATGGYSTYTLAFENPDKYQATVGIAGFGSLTTSTDGYSVAYKEERSSGFAVSGKSAVYTAASTYNYFTLDGISSLAGVTVEQSGQSRRKITLAQSALGGYSVTLADTAGDSIDYSLELASGVQSVENTPNFWSGGGGNSLIYQYGTTQGWSLSSNSKAINYTAAVDSAATLFTIDGLSTTFTVGDGKPQTLGGITVEKGDSGYKNVTLDKTLLYSSGASYTVSIADATGGASYVLALGSGVSGAALGASYYSVASAANASATSFVYQRDLSEGWSLASGSAAINYSASVEGSSTVFTLTGLSAGLTVEGKPTAVNGITIEGTTVILGNEVLAQSDGALVSLSGTGNYSLSLATSVVGYSAKDSVRDHWEVTEGSGSATFLYNPQSGYTLNSNSAVYKVGETVKFLTITGLSAGLSAANLTTKFGRTLGTSTVENTVYTLALDRSVLGSTSVVLKDEKTDDTTTYKFSLDNDATVGAVSSATLAPRASGGKINVNATIVDYYTLDGTSKVDYVDSTVASSIAVIDGVSIGSANKYSGVTISGTSVILGEGAFAKKGISFAKNYKNASGSSVFTFALDQNLAGIYGDGKQLYDYKDAVWSFAAGTGNSTATYTQEVLKGYSLAEGGSAVTYDSTQATVASYMTLSGLKSGVTKDAIYFDGGKVYLTDDAIGTSSITLGISTADYSTYGLNGYSGYKLAFENDHSTIAGASYFQAASVSASGSGANSLPASTNLIYKQVTSAGFTFDSDSLKATYSGESTATFFTLEGLTDKIGQKDSVGAGAVAGVTVDDEHKLVTLTKDVLIARNVSISGTGNYSLSLAGNYGVQSLTPYWGTESVGSASTKATYQYNTTQGWALSGTSSVKYTAATSGNSLAIIEGLKSGVVASGSPAAIAGITVGETTLENGGASVTFTLDKRVLTNQNVTLTDINESDNINYALALEGDYSAALGASYYSITSAAGAASTALTYQRDLSEGWSLSSNSLAINYSASVEGSAKLFTLTGLSAGVTGENGITVTAETGSASKFIVTVDQSVLGTSNIQLSDANTLDAYTYSLSFASDVVGYSSIDSVGAYWDIATAPGGGISATLLYNPRAGFTQSGNSAAYTAGTVKRYLTLTGLSTALDAAALSTALGKSFAEGTHTLTLDRSVLGGLNVSLKDEDANDNINFVLALADSVTAGTISGDATLNVNDTDVEVKAQRGDYYSLTGSSTVTYTGESANEVVAKISGLSTTDVSDNVTVSGNTITLGESALNKADVSLTSNYNDYYKLALEGGVTRINTYSDKAWTFNNGKATYDDIVYDGYIKVSNTSITYNASASDSIRSRNYMTLTGLKLGADSSAITVDSAGKFVVLGDSAISTVNIALTATGTDYRGYGLSFEDMNGHARQAGASYFAVNGNEITYNQDTGAGFSINGAQATYSPLTTEKFFTISGLSSGRTTNATLSTDTLEGATNPQYSALDGVSIDGQVVTISESALTNNNVTLTHNGGYSGYSLSLEDEDGVAPDTLDGTKGYDGYYFASVAGASGTFTFKYDSKAGWSKENDSLIAYTGVSTTELATITGLSAGLELAGGSFSGLTDDPTINPDEGTIKLTSEMLGTSDVSITSGSYSFAVDTTDVAEPEEMTDELYWRSNNSSEVYYGYGTKPGFVLSADGKLLDYQTPDPVAYVTITGLSSSVVEGLSAATYDATVNAENLGVSINGGVITLGESALAGKAVKLTVSSLSAAQEGNYSLSLADGVATTAKEAFSWSINQATSNANANLYTNNEAYYTLDSLGANISYTEATSSVLVATLKNLNKDVDASYVSVSAYTPSVAAVADDPNTTEDETVAEVKEKIGTITLGQSALTSLNATLTLSNNYKDKYVLALDKVTAPGLGSATWSVTSGTAAATAIYSAPVTLAGHALSADSLSVNYTGTTDAKTLIRLNGLSKDVTATQLNIADNNYLTVNNKVITVKKKALNGTNVTVSDNSVMGYTLALEPENINSRYYTEAHEANVWRMDGTTATLKRVTLGYYSYDDATNQIVYHKEEDVKNGNTPIVYAKITGLASGLLTDDKGGIFAASDSHMSSNLFTVTGLSFGINDSIAASGASGVKTITIGSRSALATTTDAKITTGDYTFSLSAGVAPRQIDGTAAWTIDSKSNAIYKAAFDAGYTLSNNDKTVSYVSAKTNDIASITGLNANATIGTGAASLKIGYMSGTTFVEGITQNNGVFTVKNDSMLGTGDASVKTNIQYNGNDYTFTLGTDVTEKGDAEDKTKTNGKWASKTSVTGAFTYAYYKPAYYTLDSLSTAIIYTAENKSGDDVVTLTGLNSAALVSDGKLGTTDTTTNAFAENVTIDTSRRKVTLNNAVLGTGTVSASGDGYVVTPGTDVKTNTEIAYNLTYSAGNATLTKQNSAYYTFDNNTATYNQSGDASTVTEITGLATDLTQDGLDLKDSGGMDAVTVDPTTSKVTLTDKALKGSNVTVTGNYSIDASAVTKPQEDKRLVVKDGTVTYQNYTKAGYTLSQDAATLTYSDDTAGKDIFSISGLNKDIDYVYEGGKIGHYVYNLDLDKDDFKTLITIDNSATPTKTVTIKDAAVLGNSDIELTGDGYSLKLDSELETYNDGKIGFTQSSAWDYTAKSGTLTYTFTTAAGYELDGNKITYTPQEDIVTTISGIAKNLNLETSEGKLGVTADSTFTPYFSATGFSTAPDADGKVTVNPGTITILTEDALTTSNVTATTKIGNKTPDDQYYKLALDTTEESGTKKNVNFFNDSDITNVFKQAKGKDTVTYGKTIAKDSYVCDDNGTKITYYNKENSTVYATIKGLKTSSTDDFSGSDYAGITVVKAGEDDDPQTNQTATENQFLIDKRALPESAKNNAAVTLTTSKTGGYTDYVLALDTTTDNKVTDPTAAESTTSAYWITDPAKGTATYQTTTYAGYYYDTKNKKIVYTIEKDTPLFTVSGLTLTGDKVSKPDSTKDTAATDWQTFLTDHATLDGLEVVTGDGGTKVKDADGTEINVTGVKLTATFDAEDNTYKNALLSNKKVAIKSSDKKSYTIDIADELTPQAVDADWEVKGTTATYKAGTSEGYTADSKNTSVSYVAAKLNTILGTITGLAKGVTKALVKENISAYNTGSGYEFTVGKGVLEVGPNTASTVKVANAKNGKTVTYTNTIALDTTDATLKAAETPSWTANGKGTIIYAKEYTEDAYVETNSQTLTRMAKGKNKTTLFTLTGISTAVAAGGVSSGTTGDVAADTTYTAMANNVSGTVIGTKSGSTFNQSNVIKVDGTDVILSKEALGTANIALKGTGYSLKLDDTDGTIRTTKPTAADKTANWNDGKTSTKNGVSTKTVTLNNTLPAYYTLDTKKNTIKYNKAVLDKASATITGIASTAAVGTDYTVEGTVITLNKAALPTTNATSGLANNTKITLNKKQTYKFALNTTEGTDKIDNTVEYGTEWKASGRNSVYNRSVTTNGWALTDDFTVTYLTTATKATTLATIKGLGATIAEDNNVSVDADGTITFDNSKLGDLFDKSTANIMLTGTGYKFDATNINALSGIAPEVANNNVTAANNKGIGTLTGTVTAGHLFSDNNTIAYVKKLGTLNNDGTLKKAATLATVKGLAPNAADWGTLSGRTLSLSAAFSSKATVDGTGIIAFDLGKAIRNTLVAGGAKNDTITAAGTGISLSTAAGNDSITATGDNASINAGAGNDFITADGASATILGDKGNDHISIGGENASVTAGDGDDTITFTGTGSVNAGKGNDVLDLGTDNGAVTVFYAVNEGNDVIANFSASDKFRVTTSNAKASIAASGEDLIVKVASNSAGTKNATTITLDGAATLDSFTVYKGTTGTDTLAAWTKPSVDLASSADLLYDSNYADGSDLGDIVNGSDNGLLTGDLNNTTDPTNLTNQTPTATYGSKK